MWIDHEALIRTTLPRAVVAVLVVIHFAVLLLACPQQPMQPVPNGHVGSSAIPEYDRSEWGRWIDADKDCQDTRQEVLIDESLVPVTLDERGCKVLSGRWECAYTGKTFTDPSLLDIDHVVPLREAHFSGGWGWSKERKREFFNHMGTPLTLTAVDRSANRSKGSKTPVEWLPAVPRERCTYVKIWVRIKQRWGLDMTCEESAHLAKLLADCP